MNTETPQTGRSGTTLDPHWKGILESASLEVFQMMAGVDLTLQSAGGEPSGELTAMVGMAGALCGMTTIRCKSETGGKLAGRMLGGDAASNPSMVADALGELCNMVAGNFKAKISTLADRCLLSVPTVISGGSYQTHAIEPTECLVVSMAHEGATIWVLLTIHT